MLLKSGGGSFSMVSDLALSPPQHPDRRDQTKPFTQAIVQLDTTLFQINAKTKRGVPRYLYSQSNNR